MKLQHILALLFSSLLCSGSVAAGDAAAGEKLAAPCAACHMADGNSVAPNWPKLAGMSEKYLLKQLQDIKSGARAIPEMTGQLDAMNEQNLADMAAFFASQEMTGSAADPELVELGQAIYRGGIKESQTSACMACHSPTGKGNSLAGYPRLSGQHATYIENQLLKFQTGERDNDAESVMRDIAKRMTAAEIKAVSSYAAGLR